jgi:hypothetical protein
MKLIGLVEFFLISLMTLAPVASQEGLPAKTAIVLKECLIVWVRRDFFGAEKPESNIFY